MCYGFHSYSSSGLVLLDSLRVDDWDSVQVGMMRLQEQGKVIFHQPYPPKHPEKTKRPFVVVIQDELMRIVSKKISKGNAWALDSTFKTNQWDLPLYAAIVPNQDGKRMPVFYMLCTKDKNEGHESIAIELVLSTVFVSIGEVRSSAIVIDKHKTSLNSINKVISNDIHCWRFVNATKVQIMGRVHLCHFHMMKAWSENLLTCVPEPDKEKLWQSLHVLLHCPNKSHFEVHLQKLYNDF